MNFYLAPLEGVTGHVFRKAYDELFGDIDCYFTPFISANDHLSAVSKRELETVLRAPLIPQILGNDPDKVLAISSEMAEKGYDTFNLNFGCPSGTVTGKNRGSGMLKDLRMMDDFLDRIFRDGRFKYSLKTRIDWADESEWKDIVAIYQAYPFQEIIIHPRLRKDLYQGSTRRAAFEYALTHLPQPLCYNGDINTVEDYNELCQQFPTLERVMIGRGIVRNPLLISQIRSSESLTENQPDEYFMLTEEQKQLLRRFVRRLEADYLAEMQTPEHAVMRMKEFFSYFGTYFPGREKALKELRKAKSLNEYRLIVSQFL